MPIIFIHQNAGRTVEQKRRIIEGFTKAMAEAYGVPPDAVTVFFEEYTPESWGKSGKLHGDAAAMRAGNRG